MSGMANPVLLGRCPAAQVFIGCPQGEGGTLADRASALRHQPRTTYFWTGRLAAAPSPLKENEVRQGNLRRCGWCLLDTVGGLSGSATERCTFNGRINDATRNTRSATPA
ncbi:hypothetical protein GOP47_0006640 [Adiantum capillus-veneris]|uniref:Uncharacterized protein n=1 Tax=Adiantum capillus-veneris TaxID=13818 RepID=A0A9D4ZKL6_ADICA|nr:hypothetical protein GOP47_0006640 [Adiantum capillus-veneris]